MVYDEIQEFGRRIGLTNLDLSGGPVTLDIEEIGRLTMTLKNEPGEEAELTLMLVRNFTQEPEKVFRRLLAEADWRSNPPYTIQTGELGERVFVLTRLPESRLRGAEIENALRYLSAQLSN
jgi:type III secretion system chaperone SycN